MGRLGARIPHEIDRIGAELPKEYYLTDDWGDNKLTDREGLSNFRNRIPPRTWGKDRPKWTIESGSPSASGGVLVLPQSSTVQTVSTPSDFTVGAWELDFKWANTTSTQWDRNWFMRLAGEATGYWMRANNDGSACDIIETTTGTHTVIIDNTWTADTSWHTLKATRDSAGNFELFLDGVSKGTTTDTTHTTSDEMWIRDDGNDVAERNVDNLKVY